MCKLLMLRIFLLIQMRQETEGYSSSDSETRAVASLRATIHLAFAFGFAFANPMSIIGFNGIKHT